MFHILKARINHGYQAIKDIRKAEIKMPYRGYPVIQPKQCPAHCDFCISQCPSKAISKDPFFIDLGKCVACGECQNSCLEGKIQFSNFHKTASISKKYLLVHENQKPQDYYKNAIVIKKEIKRIFSRSLKLRQVSAGGCNACEMELNACSNVNFDMGRFGIDIVASPRHADGIIVTGPVSENMAKPLEETYLSVGSPKIIVLAGACAISGGVFQDSVSLNRAFLEKERIDLYIPGCPVHPLTVINGILDFLGRK